MNFEQNNQFDLLVHCITLLSISWSACVMVSTKLLLAHSLLHCQFACLINNHDSCSTIMLSILSVLLSLVICRTLLRSLGSRKDIEPMTDAVLMEHGVDTEEFSAEVHTTRGLHCSIYNCRGFSHFCLQRAYLSYFTQICIVL